MEFIELQKLKDSADIMQDRLSRAVSRISELELKVAKLEEVIRNGYAVPGNMELGK